MNIKRENIGHLNELISVELTPDDYQVQVEKSLKDLKRKATISGFRKGMVPMGMIEKMYGKSVRIEEISKLTNDAFYNYLKENKLRILFDPMQVESKSIGDFERTDNFSFSFEIGLRPEVVLNYDEAKKVIKYKVTATEEEIDAEITSLRKRAGTYASNETVEEDDFLIVTLTPADGREKFTSTIMLNYVKESEVTNFIGKKLGDEMEFDTKGVFKSDYECSTFLKVKIDDIESFPTTVHIKIDAIHHIVPAELDADFFAKLFPEGDITDEAGLREIVKLQIESRHINDTDAMYRYRVMDTLLNHISFTLPDSFIKKYLVEKKETYTADNIDEKYDDIKKSVNYQLVEGQLADDFHIDVNREEIQNFSDKYIRQTYFGTLQTLDPEEEDRVKQLSADMMKNEENVNNIYENIFFRKLIHSLTEKLNPKIKELSFKDFVDELNEKKETPAPTRQKESKKAESGKQKAETVANNELDVTEKTIKNTAKRVKKQTEPQKIKSEE